MIEKKFNACFFKKSICWPWRSSSRTGNLMCFCILLHRTGRPALLQRGHPTPSPFWPPPAARPGRWGAQWAQRVLSSPMRAPSAQHLECFSSGAMTCHPAQPSAHIRWPSRCPRCSSLDTCSLAWVTIIITITPIITTMSCLLPLQLNHHHPTPLNSPLLKCCPHSHRPTATTILSITMWDKTSPASSQIHQVGIICPEAMWKKGSNGGAFPRPTLPLLTTRSPWADSWFWGISPR